VRPAGGPSASRSVFVVDDSHERDDPAAR